MNNPLGVQSQLPLGSSWGPVSAQENRAGRLLHRGLVLAIHEQIPSDLIRKTVTRLGADRRHWGVIELQ